MSTELPDLPSRRHVPQVDGCGVAARSKQLAVGGKRHGIAPILREQSHGPQAGDGADRQRVAVTVEAYFRGLLLRGGQSRDEEKPGQEERWASAELRGHETVSRAWREPFAVGCGGVVGSLTTSATGGSGIGGGPRSKDPQ